MVLLLGGSFDPFHEGHLHLVRKLLEINHPEKLYLVPAKINPLKGKASATPQQRLEMLRLAVAELNDARVVVSDEELRREGPSFTVDTVRALRKETGKDLALVLGNEIYCDLPRWKDPVHLLTEAHLIVVARERSAFNPLPILAALGLFSTRKEANRWFHSKGKWIELQEVEALPISSTQLREAVQQRYASGSFEPMPHGIQRSVWQYIKENRLYAVSKE